MKLLRLGLRVQASVTTSERKPILGDASILWPGTRVVIKSDMSQGIILYSIKYGETYFVSAPTGEVLTLKKNDMEIMSCE